MLVSLTCVQVVTPYFPYSKGDQKTHRSPITSKLVANMLKRLLHSTCLHL